MKKYISCLIVLISLFAHSQNVGIGTTTPISKLTLQTPLNAPGFTHIGGSDEIIVSENIGGVSASFGTSTNHAFRLNSNGLARISIYPAGEVVVGDNNFAPLGKFAVQSPTATYGITNSDGNIILSTFLGGSQQFAYIGTQSNHPLSFYTNNSASQAILQTNGNFGIGINTPAYKLHVNGAGRFEGNGEFYGSVSTTSGGIGVKTPAIASVGINIIHDNEAIRIAGIQPYITFFNGVSYKGYVWSKGADDMELGTASVNTNGKLFLSIKGNPYLTLHPNGRIAINGPLSNFGVNFKNSQFTVNGPVVLKDIQNNFNEWGMDSYFEDLSFLFNGLLKAFINVSGEYVQVSDARLKEDIELYKPVLDGIRNLSVSTYHYKSDPNSSRSFGLIAQNVAEYFPELVSPFYDQDGNKFLGIAYNKTGVIAIKAIQEQQKIIDQQKEEINNLKERLTQLEKLITEKMR